MSRYSSVKKALTVFSVCYGEHCFHFACIITRLRICAACWLPVADYFFRIISMRSFRNVHKGPKASARGHVTLAAEFPHRPGWGGGVNSCTGKMWCWHSPWVVGWGLSPASGLWLEIAPLPPKQPSLLHTAPGLRRLSRVANTLLLSFSFQLDSCSRRFFVVLWIRSVKLESFVWVNLNTCCYGEGTGGHVTRTYPYRSVCTGRHMKTQADPYSETAPHFIWTRPHHQGDQLAFWQYFCSASVVRGWGPFPCSGPLPICIHVQRESSWPQACVMPALLAWSKYLSLSLDSSQDQRAMSARNSCELGCLRAFRWSSATLNGCSLTAGC